MTPTLPVVTSLPDADYISGALMLIDKPKGWTSFDVVNKIRSLLRQRYGVKNIKVGHSGTLDPMATGLLVICTGGWTKELHGLQGLDKIYLAECTLGIETDTYDAEGRVVAQKEAPVLSEDILVQHLESFVGETEQYPPAYSAIKKDGKPLYALARAGQDVKTEPRRVKVYAIRLEAYRAPMVRWTVHSGSGFYVRSMAHDLGKRIGCGAHLSALVRTAIGPYRLENAFTMDEIAAALGRK